MISTNHALLFSCTLLVFIQSYSTSLAFQIPAATTSTTPRGRQQCLFPAMTKPVTTSTTTTTIKSTGILHAAVFDMPSREKEDERELQRKKNIIRRNEKKFRLSNIVRRGRPSKKKEELMTQVHTLEDFKTHVADVKDALVVAFYTAPWCRTCQSLKPKMKAMANSLREEEEDDDDDNNAQKEDVQLVQIPLLNKESAALFQGLGVKSFPFVHIYHPTEGLVEELRLNRKLWNEFQTTLQEYREGSCELKYHKDGTIRHDMRITLDQNKL